MEARRPPAITGNHGVFRRGLSGFFDLSARVGDVGSMRTAIAAWMIVALAGVSPVRAEAVEPPKDEADEGSEPAVVGPEVEAEPKTSAEPVSAEADEVEPVDEPEPGTTP